MVIGQELTPSLLVAVAEAVAEFVGGEGPVLVARDFRTTSPGIARLLAGTLSIHGVDVVEMGAMPTPCLQFNVKELHARLGLTVTASHNPTEFNGVKFTGPEGVELSREDEVRLESAVFAHHAPPIRWEAAKTPVEDTQGIRRYLRSIRQHVDREAIARHGARVVLDPGNGTSAVTSPTLLRELGASVSTLHAQPDGFFPGRPSEPKEENLADLKKAVLEFGAEVGVAHDGDSDRAAFVDDRGRFVPGEITLALFAQYVLSLHPEATVVTSVTSSSCVRDVVAQAKGQLVVTRSGSLPVARAAIAHHAVFAGEENGGYYWPEHQVARDGPMSSAKMLELIARAGRPLSELLDALPRYVVVKSNVPLPKELRVPVVASVTEALGAEGAELSTLDGVKAFFPDGWVLVRPSGTEPLCRIFAESRESSRARQLLDLGRRLVADAQAAFTPPDRA